MHIPTFLTSFGLSETEIAVYLAALKVPHASASELAEATQLKRPRIYHALATLEDKGLVVTVGSKVKRFKAEPPEQLQLLLKRRKARVEELEETLKKAMPFFPAAQALSSMGEVEIFRGREGLLNLAERIYRTKGDTLYAINPSFDVIEKFMSDHEGLSYLNLRAQKELPTKTIWQDMPENLAMADHERYLRDMRLAPVDQFGAFQSGIQILGNTVLIINFLPELFGISITSAAFAQTMQHIWQLIWAAATPVDSSGG